MNPHSADALQGALHNWGSAFMQVGPIFGSLFVCMALGWLGRRWKFSFILSVPAVLYATYWWGGFAYSQWSVKTDLDASFARSGAGTAMFFFFLTAVVGVVLGYLIALALEN